MAAQPISTDAYRKTCLFDLLSLKGKTVVITGMNMNLKTVTLVNGR